MPCRTDDDSIVTVLPASAKGIGLGLDRVERSEMALVFDRRMSFALTVVEGELFVSFW